MSKDAKVRSFVYGIIVLNLLVLAAIFLYPRVRYMAMNSHLTFSERAATPGALDMPNQFHNTYRAVNQIRDLTPRSSTIFLPPGDVEDGLFRSASIQTLFPRRVFFGSEADSQKNLKEAGLSPDSFLLSGPNWYPGYCAEKAKTPLKGSGFEICRIMSAPLQD